MTQIKSLTERDAKIVAQEVARTYDDGELYDSTTVFVRLCDSVQVAYPSLPVARLYVIVRRVLRRERGRRRAAR